MSSYAPTIRSLFYTRQTAATQSVKTLVTKTLLVGMPTTLGLKELPFADEEVKQLTSLLSQYTRVRPMPTPTKSEVMGDLEGAQIVHFACHGQASYPDPSNSTLSLEDWQKDPLTLADIMSMKLKDSRLIYLSACHAASNRSEELLDESLT